MVLTTDIENLLDKIQHAFMIKNKSKLKTNWDYINLIKGDKEEM